MLREHKKTKPRALSKLENRKKAVAPRGRETGGHVEPRSWLALAIGTPGSWRGGAPRYASGLSEKCPQEVPGWGELGPCTILHKSERGKHLCTGSCMGAQEGPAKAAFPPAQPGLQKLEGPFCPFPAPIGP